MKNFDEIVLASLRDDNEALRRHYDALLAPFVKCWETGKPAQLDGLVFGERFYVVKGEAPQE